MRRSSIESILWPAFRTLSIVLWLLPAIGRAQPERDAEAFVQRGLQARKEQRDADALQDFLLAYQAQPSARALAQVALAEEALGRWVESEEHLNGALHSRDDPWIERHRPALEGALESVRDQLATLELSGGTKGIDVLVNGVRVGSLPTGPQRVPAGQTTIELRGDGLLFSRQTLTLEPRQSLRVAVLAPIADGSSPDRTKPPSTLLPPPEAAPGLAGQIAVRRLAVRKTLAWSLLASGAAFLVTGIIAHVVHENAFAVYNDDGRCFYGTLSRMQRCGRYLGEGQAAGVIAVAGYAGAALTLAASAYFFLAPAPVASSPGMTGRWPLGLRFGYHASF